MGAESKARQHQIGHDRNKINDRRHGAESKCTAHEDKDWPITTWKRPIGEKCVAHGDKMWHMEIKAGPLLHGGGL